MTPTQCKMIRVGLNLSGRQLAAAAGISPGALVRFERCQGATNTSTQNAIERALTDRGAVFGCDGSVRISDQQT